MVLGLLKEIGEASSIRASKAVCATPCPKIIGKMVVEKWKGWDVAMDNMAKVKSIVDL